MSKRARQLCCVGVFLAPIVALAIWCAWVVKEFHLPKPYSYNLVRAAHVAFTAPNLRPLTWTSILLGTGLTGFLLSAFYVIESPRRRRWNHVRGVEFIDQDALARYTFAQPGGRKGADRRNQITVAGVPIPRHLERLHFLIGGTTQSGKSVTITEMLAGALGRGDRVIVADPNGDYYSRFGATGDTVLNPFDLRSAGWSIFNEIEKPYDVQRYARSVIPDARSAQDVEWHGYAQLLFAETAGRLIEAGNNTTAQLMHWLTVAKIEALGALLEETAAVGLFDIGAQKALSSTRFILTKYLNPHQHLKPGSFSLRHWLAGGQGNLYLTWREDMAEALRPLMSTWFDVLVSSLLSLPPDEERRIWFFLDELASMERLSSLEDGLTKGAKHGGRFVCGLQSTAQLDDIYTRDKATVLRSCFRNLLVLNIPNTDPATAEEFSRGLGEREYTRKETSKSLNYQRGPTRTVAERYVRERAVLPAEIHALPDLTGYLKLAGDYPIAKVALAPRDYPQRRPAIWEA